MFFLNSWVYSQYIGVKSKVAIDDSQYSFYNFDGNLILKLGINEIPYFSSFLMKKYDYEEKNWSIEINERFITHHKGFFITKPNQNVLPISTQDSTYIVDFKGKILKSFKDKYKFLSQPNEGVFLGYRFVYDDTRRGYFMLTFLNEEGLELFDSKEFCSATLFSNGHALVQETNEYGDWKIINTDGEETLNLSQVLKHKIIKAFPFVNGFANIVVEILDRDKVDESINNYLKEKEASIYGCCFYAHNLTYEEKFLNSVSLRINLQGESELMPFGLSVLDDMYYREYYNGLDYSIHIGHSCNLDEYNVIDSLVNKMGKYYIAFNKSIKKNFLINCNGEIIDFPEKLTPIKCIGLHVLGKHRNNYVLYNPEDSSSFLFKDTSLVRLFDKVAHNSSEGQNISLEELIIFNNRILKTDLSNLNAILSLEGELIFDFRKSDLDSIYATSYDDINVDYECPDSLDFKQIRINKNEVLFIDCQEIDFKDFVDMSWINIIGLSGFDILHNSELIVNFLNQDKEVHIFNVMKSDNLGIDFSSIHAGELHINEELVLSKR